ncbi:cytochrome c oxidase assembly protein [Methylocapsa palsarum]|uniref:cytochrome c oxidase assembly protein n=1 Tax=Methylocapsa palsarum TaxID=1612308 RepID=UPI003CC7A158
MKGRRGIAIAIAGASLLMLGLSFASAPLYRMYCAATGFGGTTQVAKTAPSTRGLRDFTVRFDANVAPGLTWRFEPETPEIKLRTGETATIFYRVTNMSDHETSAQAMYNVSPESAGAYFDKISCFCFAEQTLGPRETMEMPVVFFLDPAIENDQGMRDVHSVTLSYTFFAAKPVATGGADAGKKSL